MSLVKVKNEDWEYSAAYLEGRLPSQQHKWTKSETWNMSLVGLKTDEIEIGE